MLEHLHCQLTSRLHAAASIDASELDARSEQHCGVSCSTRTEPVPTSCGVT
jgi:hypothetical protein